MTTRDAEISGFLAGAGWSEAARSPITGDASARRYERLARPDGKRAILMDDPPGPLPGVVRFRMVADHLTGLGLSAPEIFAGDDGLGLLLLEDLGDDLFARLLDKGDADEAGLYAATVDALVELHRAPPPDWAEPYDMARLLERATLALDWYRAGADGVASGDEKARFTDSLREALSAIPDRESVLVLRDVHAENLIWLPDRSGPARVGLLDFQDAEAGHPAYDLISLLSDARRDVPRDLARAMKDRYIAATGTDREAFLYAAAALSAQRNLRILGTFARLSMRDGKPRYVDFIPRVWRLLMEDLSHPDLAALRACLDALLPEPDAPTLKWLKDLCATVPAA